jgi:VWFA-related protein
VATSNFQLPTPKASGSRRRDKNRSNQLLRCDFHPASTKSLVLGVGSWQLGVVALLTLTAAVSTPQAQQRPVFRSTRELISIDVTVRDKDGNVVRGLTAADFELKEDGQAQQVENFTFQEISDRPAAAAAPAELLAGVEAKMNAPVRAVPASDAAPAPMTSDALAGRRLMVLLFDTSSMQPEDVQRAVDSARTFVKEQMSPADLIAVATVATTLNVLTDFTGERERVDIALGTLAYTDGVATEPPPGSTLTSEEAAAAAEEATAEASDLDMFNNDVRLRALRTLSETLSPIEQKKAIVYFSAGMARSGQDNMVELRAAVNASVRAHVAIYPIDVRGLQAVVPGGDARQASGRGQDMFSGRGTAQQFSQLASSQDTLVSLAGDTGGRAFTDSNDFGAAFARVQRDMSAYYLLGYSSTNPNRDGRFRRVQVRVKKEGFRVEARAGYYAARDFAHTNRGDRETQLQEQLFSDVSATDVPVLVTGGFFRLAADRYYVPITVAIPGSAVTVPPGKDKTTLDVMGMVRDEQGRPLGRIRQTMDVAAGANAGLESKQVLYQTAVTLPPGRFAMKVVVRENVSGAIGSFETAVVIPELKQAPVKVSSVVLSTQLQPSASKGRTDSPLVRDGMQIVPNVTHVVGRSQKLFFYFEVYEPALAEAAPDVRASLAFYRGKIKVLETPIVERAVLDAPDRKAALFRLEVPADAFKPGLYTCQVNVIDAAAGKFAFPRLAMLVR